MDQKYNHYFKSVEHLSHIDVYRIISLFNITDPCIQHALKKLLVAGGRTAGKDITTDINEAIASLERWKEMRKEEAHEEILEEDSNSILRGDPSLRTFLQIEFIYWPIVLRWANDEGILKGDPFKWGDSFINSCAQIADSFRNQVPPVKTTASKICTKQQWYEFMEMVKYHIKPSDSDRVELEKAAFKIKAWYWPGNTGEIPERLSDDI